MLTNDETCSPDAGGAAADVHSWLTPDQPQQTAEHQEKTYLVQDFLAFLLLQDFAKTNITYSKSCKQYVSIT